MSAASGAEWWADVVTGDEAEAWIARVLGPLMEAGEPEAERRLLAEEVVAWGPRALLLHDWLLSHGSDAEQFSRWKETVQELFVRWLGGDSITERVDEDERRANVALLELADPSRPPLIHRLAAAAVLQLPEGHPQRDVGPAAATLHRVLAAYEQENDIDGQLATIDVLLDHHLVDGDELDRLVERGSSLAAAHPEAHHARGCLLAITSAVAGRVIAARDRGADREMARWNARLQHLVDIAESAFSGDRSFDYARALQLELDGRLAEAAAHYAALASLESHVLASRQTAQRQAGRLFHQLGEWEQAVDALQPLVEGFISDYVAALRPSDVLAEGSQLGQYGRLLTEALARAQRWDDASDVLDRMKSIRLRARRGWRESAPGRDLLALERALHAVARGAPGAELPPGESFDLLGQVTPQSALLEAYRRVRPGLESEVLATPAPDEVAGALRPDEAVVALGLFGGGTLVMVLDRSAPHWRGQLLEDWGLPRWNDAFAGRESGLLYALGAHEAEIDRPAALDRALASTNDALEPVLPALLPEGVGRVTIIPHLVLHLLPFWALPCLQHLDVATAPSIAQLVAARARPPGRLAGRTVIVINPTRDLLAGEVEAASARRALEASGLVVDVLREEEATESAVGAALDGAVLWHFGGHGVGDLTEPDRSALLMAPEPDLVPDGDPFPALVAAVTEWQDGADGESRFGETPQGRIGECRLLGGRWVERWIDAGPTTTLWAHYVDGRLRRVAERWSAADLLVDSRLRSCQLAVLSACESAMGTLDYEVDEMAGLPAALELAGVGTVVATMWPVAEVPAALFTHLFYERLVARRGTVDVRHLVGQTRRQLQQMPRDELLVRVEELRSTAVNPRARLCLEAYGRKVRREAQDQPLAGAWEWAAFTVLGRSEVIVGGGSDAG